MRRIGTILAERRLAEQVSGKVVRVSLGAPRPGTDDADWECPFRIHGAGISRVEFGYGIDSMQALTTALDGIRVLLDESGLALGWKMGAGRARHLARRDRVRPLDPHRPRPRVEADAWSACSTARSVGRRSVWSAGRSGSRSRRRSLGRRGSAEGPLI